MKSTTSYLHGLAIKPIAAPSLAAIAILLANATPGHAQNGTWTLNGTGAWSNSANWLGSVVADGTGNTATFNSGGATIHLDSPRTIGNLFTAGAAGAYVIDNNGSGSNILTLAGTSPTISTVASTTITISAQIAGTSGLTKTGASSSGILNLTGVNTYSGTTLVTGGNAGFLQINSNAALGSSTLTLNSQNGGLRYGAAFNDLRDVSFGVNGGRIDTNGFDVTISSNLSGSIGTGAVFNKVGAGNLTLAGSNNITGLGGVSVSGGSLQVDSNARLGSAAGPLTLSSGGGIRYGAAFNDLRSLSLGSGGGTIDTNGFNVTYSQTISGVAAQNLTKAGAGTLSISSNQSYLGTTTINAGTLLINGDNSGATGNVTVAALATLGGKGTVGGATTVNNTGKLSAGDGVGTLTFASNLSLAGGAGLAGATAIFEGGDLVAVNGTLTLTNDWNLTLMTGFQDGGSVTLFTYGTAGGTRDLTPDIDISGLGFTPTSGLTLTDTGSAIVLNGISVVPEPTTAILLLGAVSVLGLAKRRRLS